MFTGVKNQQSKSCSSCMLHTFLTRYMSLQKLSSYFKQYEVMACTIFWHQRRLVHNGESESTLEHDMPTSPYLCLY